MSFTLNQFKAALKDVPNSDFRSALIDVTDTAHLCKAWFETYGVSATAADIVALTKLVMEHHQWCLNNVTP
jgi:hypothetical protein